MQFGPDLWNSRGVSVLNEVLFAVPKAELQIMGKRKRERKVVCSRIITAGEREKEKWSLSLLA